MSFDVEQLYRLLPAIYRIHDIELGQSQTLSEGDRRELDKLRNELAQEGDWESEKAKRLKREIDKKECGPLKALLAVIAEQIAVLEEDLGQLYDNQFIETCSAWVVPYIGELVGARNLIDLPKSRFSPRAQVANTLAYRRRKGTAAMLEQLARDVTGWDAGVVEYFQRLATTQYMNHRRPDNLSFASLKDWERLERLGTPFDSSARTADVRRIETGRGKHNIPNIGIFLWRIRSYPITRAPAYRVDDKRYKFDALGGDIPLFTKPKSEDEITHLAEPINVPMPISRRVLDRYLTRYYGFDESNDEKGRLLLSLLLHVNGQDYLPHPGSPPELPEPKLSDLIQVCDLGDLEDGSGWAHMPLKKVAVDPVLGRIAFPNEQQDVSVSYHFGFSADIGGGEYGRAETFIVADLTVMVAKDPAVATFRTIQAALEELTKEFETNSTKMTGVIEIVDNEYYPENLKLQVPAGKSIELRAADKRRPVVILSGDTQIPIFGGENSRLSLNGLMVSGGTLHMPASDSQNQSNRLRQLTLRHCTLVPGPRPEFKLKDQTIAAQPALDRLVVDIETEVVIDRCILGSVRLADEASAQITGSVVDAVSERGIAYVAPDGKGAGGRLTVENSTLIGRVHTRIMQEASNTIFLANFFEGAAPVIAEQLQAGCVRFCYIPPGSKVPPQYRCQPASEETATHVKPIFTSLRYGEPGYCQLSQLCATEIAKGADDGAEMGVFHDLYQAQRESSLRARLDEYLRFDLEAGIFYAS